MKAIRSEKVAIIRNQEKMIKGVVERENHRDKLENPSS
jgi:hypothetical protein